MNLKIGLLILSLIVLVSTEAEKSEDLYKLLGVAKDASVKEIRKAFKNLAVKLHPDKNKDDKDADQKFIKIAHAYEVLKEPELRKKYDLYGDANEWKGKGQEYQSYSYYRDEFGIYDDDPLIVTLSRADFELNVLDQNQAWFVNFYSPQCHHCHTLAPIWRKLSVELEGVVRIAAVNCEEDWSLCRKLAIHAYPTLLYYEKDSNLFEGEHYRASHTLEELKEYVLSKVSVTSKSITKKNWETDGLKNKQWLLILCPESSIMCLEDETKLKLSAIFEDLLSVALVTEEDLYDEIMSHIDEKERTNIVFWQQDAKSDKKYIAHAIEGSDSKEIVDKILDLLPNHDILDEDQFRDIRTKLRSGEEKPWLVCFYMGHATELNLQLKRLPKMVSNINIGLVHCGKSAALCSSLHVSHYPSWGVLKDGGAFELHHGRDILNDIAAFARDSSKSTNLHALSPADFKNLIYEDGGPWFIEWHAPWCPPCRKLMPEMRKASQHFPPENIKFGTIDCTLHTALCSQQNIKSYPTAVLYNGSSIEHHYHGSFSEDGIVEFIEDMLNPSVITLDSSTFIMLMRKPEDEMWFVDYYAPWCGPCQRLSQQMRILAKQMKSFDKIKIAQVDCVANEDLCNAQHVRSYPSIRFYPSGSKGLNTVAMYNGHRDALPMKSWILNFMPSNVEIFTADDFRKNILKNILPKPWLVDFYAPWCGHCVHFEPDFRIASQKLENIAKSAKIDCEKERYFCGEMRVTSYPTVILYLSAKNWYQISSRNPDEIANKVEAIIESKNRYIRDEL